MGHVSAIVGGTLLLGTLLWLWYWVWRHTPALMRGWERARTRSRMAVLHQQARPLVGFVRARLSLRRVSRTPPHAGGIPPDEYE
jgi:hypothetical protein